MTVTSLVLAFVIATLWGVLFHLWKGGGPKRIFFFLGLAWFGFFAGYFIGLWQRWSYCQLGLWTLASVVLAH